jgi:cytochrome c oxidase assembly factor CtaG
MHSLFHWLARPTAAVTLWAAALGVWHIPRLYDGALRHPWAHDLEHASFVGAGVLVWMQLVDPARTGQLTVGRRVALAGVIFGLGQVLSDVLFLAPHPLYPAYADRTVRLFGLSPLSDQQYAGLVMMAEQLLTLGTCIVFLGVSLLRPSRRVSRLAPV